MHTPNTTQFIGKRIAATLIDYTLVFTLSFAYIIYFGKEEEDGTRSVSGLPALVPIAFWFFYFVIAEAFLDGTLGHQLMKLEVVTISGRSPSFSQTLVRRIFDAVDITWCFGLLAFILVYKTDNNQRIGDILANTLVIGKNSHLPTPDFDIMNETREIR